MTATRSWDDAIATLRQEFLRGVPERAGAIRSCCERLARDHADADALRELMRLVHALAGTAGTYGYAGVSDRCRTVEGACAGLLRDGAEPRTTQVAAWRALGDSLEQEMSGATPVSRTDAPLPTTPRVRNILIVEGGRAILDTLGPELGADELRVAGVQSRAAAIEVIDRGMPDGLIVDASLPDGSGYEFVEHVRGLPGGETRAVLIASSGAGILDRVEAVHCGADGYFEKPLDARALSRRLNALLTRSDQRPARILSIEDDPDQARFLKDVLESARFEVRVCADPEEFEEVLASFQPDLVLMDVVLPSVSGYDLARVVRQDERYAALPIVFLTAEGDVAARIASVDSGGDDHLTKPVTPALLLAAVAARVERARFVRHLLARDGLTRLLLRSAFLERTEELMARAIRRGTRDIALVMIDLDHFKKVNDTYGHLVGDRLLVAFAALLRRRLRQSDIIGRFGGEEFSVVLDGLHRADARRLMERILEEFSIMEHDAGDGRTFRSTFSAGIAMLDSRPTDVTSWTRQADEALYAAKAAGRRQVHLAEPASATDGEPAEARS